MRRSRAKWVVAGSFAALLAGTGVVMADVVGTADQPLEFNAATSSRGR